MEYVHHVTPHIKEKMSSIRGTQTEKNLLAAFAGESQARNRYTYYAGAARKEGYQKIAAIFDITADQERIHAKNFFRCLEGGDVKIEAAFPAGVIGTTEENLTHAIAGEEHEYTTLYPSFAATAQEEGFPKIAGLFTSVVCAEKYHAARFLELRTALQESTLFTRDEEVTWYCRKCGFTYTNKTAPVKCPACAHPQGYFEVVE